MRICLTVLLWSFAAIAAPKTFRVDYFHTGNATEERFSLDRPVVEPLDWPGDLGQAFDETNSGKYLFEVRDRETTAEAKEMNRTFHESLRFPMPERPVQVLLKKRDAQLAFREVQSLMVDPKDMFVDPSRPAQLARPSQSRERSASMFLRRVGTSRSTVIQTWAVSIPKYA